MILSRVFRKIRVWRNSNAIRSGSNWISWSASCNGRRGGALRSDPSLLPAEQLYLRAAGLADWSPDKSLAMLESLVNLYGHCWLGGYFGHARLRELRRNLEQR